jgi:hypothetical protein
MKRPRIGLIVRVRREIVPLTLHLIALGMSLVLAVFAADGGAVVLSEHRILGAVFAVLCTSAGCIGHVRFRNQWGVTRGKQSRILLLSVILILSALSIQFAAVAAYRQVNRNMSSNETSVSKTEIATVTSPVYKNDESIMLDRTNANARRRSEITGVALIEVFYGDLFRGCPDAIVSICFACFLETIPLLALFITVPKTRPPRGRNDLNQKYKLRGFRELSQVPPKASARFTSLGAAGRPPSGQQG